MNALRYFEMSNMTEIENMTLEEYHIRVKAYQLRNLDSLKDLHLAAWLNQQAGATDKNGKAVHKNFKAFFDYESKEREILQPAPEIKNKQMLQKVANNLKKYREEVKHV